MICYGFLFVFSCQGAAAPAVTVCPQVPPWTQGEQARLADEIERGHGPHTERALREYAQMRERARKCRRR